MSVEDDITIEPGSITKVSVMVVGDEVNGSYLITALRHEAGAHESPFQTLCCREKKHRS